jgi:hypothetical protein
MKNIVWTRPDGGVSITWINPETEAAMQAGADLAPIATEAARAERASRKTAALEALASLSQESEQLEADLRLLAIDLAADPTKTLEQKRTEYATAERRARARIGEILVEGQAQQEILGGIAAEEQQVAFHDWVRDNLGFTEDDHERILQTHSPADVAAAAAQGKPLPHEGFTCVAHNVTIPADQAKYRDAWEWRNGRIEVNATKAAKIDILRIERATDPINNRAEREAWLQTWIGAGALPAAAIDPAQPLDPAVLASWPPMAQRLVTAEREIRTLRAQL